MSTFSKKSQKNSFKVLNDSSKLKLLKNCRKVNAVKGQVLVQKGDQVSGVFLVLNGNLRVFGMHPNGKEATLYKVTDNEICLLSLNCAFSEINYPAWVGVDSKNASIAILPYENFSELFSTDKSVQDLVLQSLTATVRELMVKLDEALLSSLRDRIFSFLSYNSDFEGNIQLTHAELAMHMGTSREVVSREISLLKRSGVISAKRGAIEIKNKKN